MTLTHRISGAIATALVAATALVGLAAGPASAAQCSSSGGVSVVVDFNRGAGGGIRTACVENGGGKYADEIFRAAGFNLSYVSSSSFVCRVDGAPAAADCSQTPPETAYWGLFWAKAGSAQWVYSSYGVAGLRVPAGGALSFAFQDGGSTNQPGVAPSSRGAVSQPSPTPTRAPTTQPSAKPTKQPVTQQTKQPTTQPSARPSAAPTRASASPQRPEASSSTSTPPSARPAATATASPGSVATGSTDPSDTTNAQAGDDPTLTRTTSGGTSGTKDADGVPAWVPGAGVVGLVGAAAGAAWWRRRSLSV